nr:unnamed protein product [Digitaria exilis]
MVRLLLLRALAALLLLAAVAVAVADDGWCRSCAPFPAEVLPGGRGFLRRSRAGATLLEIKKSFRNGGNALYDWSGDGASLGYCSWRGVLCDNSNGLSGQIPDEIGDCSLLQTLDLSSNNLEGDIPFSISKLKHLENLSLQGNKFTGPIPSECLWQ